MQTKTTKKDIARAIQTARNLMGIKSKAAYAKHNGVCVMTAYRWENGETNPEPTQLIDLLLEPGMGLDIYFRNRISK